MIRPTSRKPDSGEFPLVPERVITPTCAQPRAEPPPSASPTRGLCGALMLGRRVRLSGDRNEQPDNGQWNQQRQHEWERHQRRDQA